MSIPDTVPSRKHKCATIKFNSLHFCRSLTDFIEDAPVPVNAKRLPGYYEPACIILASPPKTHNSDWSSSVHVTNGQSSRDYGTPQYFVLEKPREK